MKPFSGGKKKAGEAESGGRGRGRDKSNGMPKYSLRRKKNIDRTETGGISTESYSEASGSIPQEKASGSQDGMPKFSLRKGKGKHEKRGRKDSSSGSIAVDFSGTGDPARRDAAGRGGSSSGLSADIASSGGGTPGFSVSIRNTEPMLTLAGEGVKLKQTDGISVNLASAVLLGAVYSLLVMMAEYYELVPFVIPGAVLFFVLAYMQGRIPDRIRLFVSLGIIAAGIIVLIVLHKYLYNGFALILNQLYDSSESNQSYVYDHFSIGEKGDEHPYLCMRLAVLWTTCIFSAAVSLPGIRFRRLVSVIVVIAMLLTFAYYGLQPEWIALAVMTLSLIVVCGSGRLGSAWPLLAGALVIFGLIILIDPGENMAISRVDENLRDRLSFRTAYFMDYFSEYDDYEEQQQQEQSRLSQLFSNDSPRGRAARIIVILLPLAILIAVIVIVVSRLVKKRRKIRAGLDSNDPRTAVTAMFPYAVRWLKPYGLNIANRPFAELLPEVKSEMPGSYSAFYETMLKLWQEAVYSDHEITESNRKTMKQFVEETVRIAKSKADWKEKLRIVFRYAL